MTHGVDVTAQDAAGMWFLSLKPTGQHNSRYHKGETRSWWRISSLQIRQKKNLESPLMTKL